MKEDIARHISLACSLLRIKGARLFGRGAGRLLFPVIWVTNRCNLRCIMCDQWKTAPEQKNLELSASQWCAFIDSLKKLGSAVLVITGGEPLLRSDTPDIIKYASARGIATHLCTNGSLLEERLIARLRESGLCSLSVSLDSDRADTHNLIRGTACFDRVVAGIRSLRALAPGIRTGVNCVINKHNYDHLVRLVDLAVSLGVQQLKFDLVHANLMHRNKDIRSFDAIAFKKDDLPALRAQVRRLKSALALTKLLTNSPAYLDHVGSSALSGVPRMACYAGYISCAVDPLGRVSACDQMPGALTITDVPMERIWFSREMAGQRRDVRRCAQRCWDSTHAELNIRCSLRYAAGSAGQWLREAGYYGNGRDR